MTTEILQLGERVGWVILHSLWQGAALAVGLALLLPIINSAAARHAAFMLGMLLLAIVAVATGFILEATPRPQFPGSGEAILEWTSLEEIADNQSEASPKQADSSRVTNPDLILTRNSRANSAWRFENALPWIAGFWFAGFLWIALRKLLLSRVLGSWKRTAERSLPPKVEEALNLARKRIGSAAARVPVWISEQVAAPLIFGVVRPVVLLPASLVGGLSVADLEMVLAHEFAHWKRRDTWANAIQLVLETVFFYHPAIWWMSREARRAREEATDDVVIALGADRKSYAKMLATVSDWQIQFVPEPSLAATDNAVASRIRRLLVNPKRNRGPALNEGWGLAIITVLLILCSLVGAQDQPEEGVTVRVPATRGQILDRNGLALARNKPIWNLTLDLQAVMEAYRDEYGDIPTTTHFTKENGLRKEHEVPDIVRMLAADVLREMDLVGLATDFNARQMQIHFLETSGRVPFVYRRELPDEDLEIARKLAKSIPQIAVSESELREYPLVAFASHVLGYVMMPDASKATDAEKSAYDIFVPESSGGSGVEKGLDDYLRGKPGKQFFSNEDFAAHSPGILRKKPENGASVLLTIDSRAQMIAEQAMRKVGRGAAVVLDPQNGEILAMVSVPSFDINHFVPVISAENWQGYTDDKSAPMFNRAISKATPGCAIKPVIALAGIPSRTHELKFNCEGGVTYGNKFMKCWIHAKNGQHGELGFSDALHRDCSCYFYQFGNHTGIQTMVEMSAKLGFGRKSGIPLGGEDPGLFPSPAWLENQGLRWSDAYTAMTTIGQGFVEATPLQLASMTATVANGGKVFQPRLVKQVKSSTGQILTTDEPNLHHDLIADGVDPDGLELIRKSMWRVVNEEPGRGMRAQVGSVVAGLTGTAQTGKPKEPTNAWFVGFAPYDSPEYAVCVFVQNGESGGRSAAPIAGEMFGKLLTGAEVEVTPLAPAVGHFERIEIVE